MYSSANNQKAITPVVMFELVHSVKINIHFDTLFLQQQTTKMLRKCITRQHKQLSKFLQPISFCKHLYSTTTPSIDTTTDIDNTIQKSATIQAPTKRVFKARKQLFELVPIY